MQNVDEVCKLNINEQVYLKKDQKYEMWHKTSQKGQFLLIWKLNK